MDFQICILLPHIPVPLELLVARFCIFSSLNLTVIPDIQSYMLPFLDFLHYIFEMACIHWLQIEIKFIMFLKIAHFTFFSFDWCPTMGLERRLSFTDNCADHPNIKNDKELNFSWPFGIFTTYSSSVLCICNEQTTHSLKVEKYEFNCFAEVWP